MNNILIIYLTLALFVISALSQPPESELGHQALSCLKVKKAEYEATENIPDDIRILNQKIVEFLDYGIENSSFRNFRTENSDIKALVDTFSYYQEGGQSQVWRINNIPTFLFWDCLEFGPSGQLKGMDLRISWLNSVDSNSDVRALNLMDLFTAQSAIADIIRWAGQLPDEMKLSYINDAMVNLVKWSRFSKDFSIRGEYGPQLLQLHQGWVDLAKEASQTYADQQAVSDMLTTILKHFEENATP